MGGPRPPSEVTDKGDLTEDAAGDGGNERACNPRSAERPRKPNCGIRRAFSRAAGCPANTTFTLPAAHRSGCMLPASLDHARLLLVGCGPIHG